MILDGVYNDIKDEAGFLAECLQGREMGFDGKTLIHPSQVEPCNGVFAPRRDEVELAGRIIAAFEEAQADGSGVVTVDGRMIENLHVDEARRVLAIAEAIAALTTLATPSGCWRNDTVWPKAAAGGGGVVDLGAGVVEEGVVDAGVHDRARPTCPGLRASPGARRPRRG